MIKQNKNECTIEGKPSLIINEAANIVLNVATTIFKNTGIPEEEILAQIQQAIQINTLITAGMSIEDAVELCDPKHNIIQIKSYEENGSTTIIKEMK